jgi:hypothetical protein
MDSNGKKLINMLDQILLKFEWQDVELKKVNPLLTGESWDLFHLKTFFFVSLLAVPSLWSYR